LLLGIGPIHPWPLTVRQSSAPEKVEAMPIDPAHLASSLGAWTTSTLNRAWSDAAAGAGSAKTLLDADRAGLMLLDQAGALRLGEWLRPGGRGQLAAT
jgi:hypothetical protein